MIAQLLESPSVLPPPEPALLPRSERVAAYLARCAPAYDGDARMLCLPASTPGYHSRVPGGQPVHPTRESLNYALVLCEEGSRASLARAETIISTVCALRDLDPASATWGVWPWYREEPVERMAPPDLNWADFCGVRLAHLLIHYGSRLGAEVRREAALALHDAGYAIFRRNVHLGYTNIAVKGAIVCAAAGEALADERLLAYGRARLERFLRHTREQGGFNEYNSPTYTPLVLGEIERGLLLIRDAEARATLQELVVFAWEAIVSALHLPTGQLCGPHSRTYSDLLRAEPATFFEDRLGLPLFRPRGVGLVRDFDPAHLFLVPPQPCPEALRRELLRAAAPRLVRQTHQRSSEPDRERIGTRWFDQDACLGSINVDSLWAQRRPLIGYWRAGEGVAALRARLLHGERDFASGVLRAAQDGPELLFHVGLALDQGDFHPGLDRPKSGVFDLESLAFELALTAPGETEPGVEELEPGLFRLAVGEWQVLVRPLAFEFGGLPVRLAAEQAPGAAGLRLAINDGRPFTLEPEGFGPVVIAAHLTLTRRDEPVLPVKISAERRGDRIALHSVSTQRSLRLDAPLHAIRLG